MTNTENITKKVGGQTAYFAVGGVFTLVVGIVLQIYVANKLGASALGVFSLIEAGIAVIAGLLNLGLAPALVKFIPQHIERGEHFNIRRLLKSGLIILSILSFFSYICIFLFTDRLILLWPDLATHQTELIVLTLMLPISIIMFFIQQGLRGLHEFKHMVIGSSFIQLSAKALLAVIFLSAGWHLLGYIWAVVISSLLCVVWLAWGLIKRIKTFPVEDKVPENYPKKEWIKYSLIMYKTNIITSGTAYLDRFILGYMVSTESVGVLAIIKNLQQIPGVFLQLLLNVTAPLISTAYAKNDASESQHIYNLTTDWVIRAAFPLFVFFLMFGYDLLLLYGSEFAEKGMYALNILLFGQFINLLSGPVGNILTLSGQEKIMLKLSAIQSILLVAGFAVFIPLWGLVGAAISISLGVIAINVISLFIAKKRLALQWYDPRYKKWFLPMFICFSCAFWISNLNYEIASLQLILLFIGLYVVFHGTYLFAGLHPDDKILINHLFTKIRSRT